MLLRIWGLAGLAGVGLALSGCAPSLVALPGQGKTYAQFVADDALCRGAPAGSAPQTGSTQPAQTEGSRVTGTQYFQCMAARGHTVVSAARAYPYAYGYPYPYPYGYPYYGYYDPWYYPYWGAYGFAIGIGPGWGWGGWGWRGRGFEERGFAHGEFRGPRGFGGGGFRGGEGGFRGGGGGFGGGGHGGGGHR
ncbi:MAG TPA: hypothetical protein VE650_02180 [Acetobacteraceae bacterium]|nr:hypothetical protein [Acetobacteraceae bacterium]